MKGANADICRSQNPEVIRDLIKKAREKRVRKNAIRLLNRNRQK
jgi:hypothetical protein